MQLIDQRISEIKQYSNNINIYIKFCTNNDLEKINDHEGKQLAVLANDFNLINKDNCKMSEFINN